MATEHLEYCVIGGGIIGSWTALHLARAGVRTVLMEQFPLPHTRGSSHGASRVTRLMGDDNLAALEYSFAEWREMERLTGETLLVTTGLVNLGLEGDSYLAKYMGIVKASGYPTEWLSEQELAKKFPFLRYPGWGAASDPSGAILLAHKCVVAVQREFVRLGGRILHGSAQELLTLSADSVQVRTRLPSGEIKVMPFAKVAVCAGPWSKKLLPTCAHLLSAQAIPVTYWRELPQTANGDAVIDAAIDAAPGETAGGASGDAGGADAPAAAAVGSQHGSRHSAAAGCPVIYNARLKNIYAVPSYEYAGLVKVLVHSGPAAEPDSRDVPDLQPVVDRVSAYVSEHMPLLEHRKPAICEVCMYTMTPDSKPLMDLCHPRVAVGTGYSGSGFKHSPASGRMISALLLGTQDELPQGFGLRRYRISRFAEGDTHSLKDAGRLLDKAGRSML